MTAREPFDIAISVEAEPAPCSIHDLTDTAARLLCDEGVAQAAISVALVEGSTMRRLNNQYLQHDYDTDVLSFLLDCETACDRATGDAGLFDGESADARSVDAGSNIDSTVRSSCAAGNRRGAGKRLEGEVIISVTTALAVADEFGWSPRDELLLYLVHGLLHLCGYDDLTDDEQQLMRSREQSFLHSIGLHPRYTRSTGLTDEPDDPPPSPSVDVEAEF